MNKNRDEKEIADNQYENNDNDYNHYEDFTTPNHYIGFKNDNVMLRYDILRSYINHFN